MPAFRKPTRRRKNAELTRSEYRLWQALLNLPNPVNTTTLNLAASLGHARSDDNVRTTITNIRRKRPNILIQANGKREYVLIVGWSPCGNPLCERTLTPGRATVYCEPCGRMFKLGYAGACERYRVSARPKGEKGMARTKAKGKAMEGTMLQCKGQEGERAGFGEGRGGVETISGANKGLLDELARGGQ